MSIKPFEEYEALVKEEDSIRRKIDVYETCIASILNFVYKRTDSIHVHTVEDMLIDIHTILMDLQTELLHLRLHKNLLTCSDKDSKDALLR